MDAISVTDAFPVFGLKTWVPSAKIGGGYFKQFTGTNRHGAENSGVRHRKPLFELLEPRHLLAAQINGVVWQDFDADGILDAGEPPAPNTTVYLDLNDNGRLEASEPRTATNASGAYTFTGLAPGNYTVRQQPPDEWVQTTPAPSARLAIVESDAEFLTFRTTTGAVLQQVVIPPGTSSSEVPRALAIDEQGRVHIYNGTFTPQLSTYNPATGLWSHMSAPNWNTVNNVYYGGIAYAASHVFVTDMRISGDSTGGLVRFNLQTGEFSRFGSRDYYNVVAGADGLLYAIYGAIDVFDPNTLELKRSVPLNYYVDKLAVDEAGRIYLPVFNRGIVVYSPQGEEVGLIPINSPSTQWRYTRDIDLAPNGQIVLATDEGDIFVSDPSRTRWNNFFAGSYFWGSYAAWYQGHDRTTAATISLADGQITSANFGVYRLAPDPPSQPHLNALHDTGIAGDLKTKRNNSTPGSKLEFTVENTIPGAIVSLYAGDMLIGSATATSSATKILTNGNVLLADGAHVITTTQHFAGFPVSLRSNPLTITVDATAPVVNVTTLTTDHLRPTLQGSTNEIDAVVSLVVNGQMYVSGRPTSTSWRLAEGSLVSDLAVGQYDLVAMAVDAAGNVGTDVTLGELTIVPPTSSISGLIWEDLNADGVRTANEPGLAGIVVYLDANRNGQRDAGEATQATVANDPNTPANEAGGYQFSHLFSGDYEVRVDLPLGQSQTTQLIAHWPDSASQEQFFPRHAERMLNFGSLIASTADRFAVVSAMPISSGTQGAFVSVYRTIGDETFLETEIPVSLAGDSYGGVASLAIDDDQLLIGLPGRTVAGMTYAGEVLVYHRHESDWLYETTLTSDAVVQPYGQWFGAAVAVHGDVVIVGAPYEGTTGAAYVFERTESGYVKRQKLATHNATREFGKSIAIWNNVIVVGLPEQINSQQNRTGQAYVYERQGDQWSRTAVLESLPNGYASQAGYAVAIRDDVIVLGAPARYVSYAYGYAVVYRRVGGVWQFDAELKAPDASYDDHFGEVVGFKGRDLVISAPWKDYSSQVSGAVYVFRHDVGGWSQEAKLTRTEFGTSFYGLTMAATDSAVLVGQTADFTRGYNAGIVRISRPTIAPAAIVVSLPLASSIAVATIGATERPTRPTLVAADDSGFSASDRITKFKNATPSTTLRFDVFHAPAGANVELYIDGLLTAVGVADESGVRLETDGVTRLAEGSHMVTAVVRRTDGTTSLVSDPLAIVIDSLAPSVEFAPLVTASTRPLLKFSAAENVHSLTIDVAGQTLDAVLADGDWFVPTGALAAVAPGVYDVTATATDAAGNQTVRNCVGGLTVTATGRIAGTLFDDADGNGRRGPSEPGLTGVTVFLDRDGDGHLDAGETSQVSADDNPLTPTIDEAGNYEFVGLVEGNYIVRVVPPVGREVTGPGSDDEAWAHTELHDTITALRPSMYDGLGSAFAADNNVLVAGATMYSAYITNDGAVIYERDDATGQWREARELDQTDVDVTFWNSGFGSTVAVGRDFVAIGAPSDHLGNVDYTGSVHIFEPVGPGRDWTYTAKLTMPEPRRLSIFGRSIVAEGDTIVVGASPSGGFALNGGVYVFARSTESPNGWEVVAQFASNSTDWAPEFGAAVAMSGNLIAVSSPSEEAKGVVYLYKRSDANSHDWQLASLLRPEASLNRNAFGVQLQIEGNLLAVQSAGGLDLYDLSELATTGPRFMPSPISSLIIGYYTSISLSGRTLSINQRWSPDGGTQIWRRANDSLGDWYRVELIESDTLFPGFLHGDQYITAWKDQYQLPQYAGTMLVYEMGDLSASYYLQLAPGESQSDATFGLYALHTPELPADLSGNGIVDAADFIIWRHNVGRRVPAYAAGDANGDRLINDLDRTVVVANFGQTLSLGAAALVTAAIEEGDEIIEASADVAAGGATIEFGLLNADSETSPLAKDTRCNLAASTSQRNQQLLLLLAINRAYRAPVTESPQIAERTPALNDEHQPFDSEFTTFDAALATWP